MPQVAPSPSSERLAQMAAAELLEKVWIGAIPLVFVLFAGRDKFAKLLTLIYMPTGGSSRAQDHVQHRGGGREGQPDTGKG